MVVVEESDEEGGEYLGDDSNPPFSSDKIAPRQYYHCGWLRIFKAPDMVVRRINSLLALSGANQLLLAQNADISFLSLLVHWLHAFRFQHCACHNFSRPCKFDVSANLSQIVILQYGINLTARGTMIDWFWVVRYILKCNVHKSRSFIPIESFRPFFPPSFHKYFSVFRILELPLKLSTAHLCKMSHR